MSTGTTTQKRSGIKMLKTGEILFNEDDQATSMYIIQKGKLRLYRPKGKGFVELAVLSAGEVIGEMAYFDPKSRTRSASAAAIIDTEVIEITFAAFEKTISALNPWFKTLIFTLADRLRTSNEKVKELENNSVGYTGEYKFFSTADIVKLLSLVHFAFKSIAENKDGVYSLHWRLFNSYAIDVFNISETKIEEFVQLLVNEKLMTLGNDEDGLPKLLQIKDIEAFKKFQAFFFSQRLLKDDKKLKISSKCEKFIAKVLEQAGKSKIADGKVEINLSAITNYFNEYNIPIGLEDFQDAKNAKFCGEYNSSSDGSLTTTLNYDYMVGMLPTVRLMNAINRCNESKARKKSHT